MLAFADDIALLVPSLHAMQTLISTLEKNSSCGIVIQRKLCACCFSPKDRTKTWFPRFHIVFLSVYVYVCVFFARRPLWYDKNSSNIIDMLSG